MTRAIKSLMSLAFLRH